MSDPLERLRLDPEPVAPDPAFAARLRARLERELLGGEQMATRITAYLSVPDARRAIEWYSDVWGARSTMDPIVMPNGKIGHAQLRIGETELMLADEFPDIGFSAPGPNGSPVSLHITVDDTDAAVARAAAAGAEVTRPAETYPHGRQAGLRDPFGHMWIVSQPPAGAGGAGDGARAAGAGAPAGKHGDVGYFTLAVTDSAKAQAFYGALLGWRFVPGSVPDGWQIEGVNPHGGVWGGGDSPGVTLCYRVDDVLAAVARVRELGGTAEDPAGKPYGAIVECADDQGVRFQLWQPAPGE